MVKYELVMNKIKELYREMMMMKSRALTWEKKKTRSK